MTVIIYLCELGLVGLVLFFVLGWLPMPAWAVKVCQVLLVLLLALLAISAVSGAVAPSRPIAEPRYPHIPSPQIMKPELGR